MAKLTFMGGIHPYDGKAISKDKPIKTVLPKGDLVYPLSQHIGAPAKPVVQKGDRVLTGQKIAEADGYLSVPIFSSVSGTVKAIEPRRVVTGDNVMSIVVENDGQYEEIMYPAARPLEELTREEILTFVKEGGVAGMGGAGFPTHVKLAPKEPGKIEYVIANCAECEPYLTSDYRRMVEEPDSLIDGMKVILSLFPNARGVLAVEDNKPEAIRLLKERAAGETRISVAKLPTKYPQGSERQLIYAVTGRAINSSQLPADAGCIVDNVDTIVAVNRAVRERKPLITRIVTVTGDAVAEPQNFRVRIGTNYHELIEEAGGFAAEPARIVSGGPMMGFGIFDLDVPTTRTASALLCLSKDEVGTPSACINCGRCVEACPSRLVPTLLERYAVHYDTEMFLKRDGMECCECGCCSYVCPAKRQLTQAIKSMRRMILADRKKTKGGGKG
ncbi:MAG TPA: electron transport complex subunit RsxC [Candidatus Eisenbergiella stercorigallinarum]|uniref:Ion-translocating oxidoreductase complex subunit C n=1 Tax=Candidatus Eisenbergiella stercorigallinarum TaxID=2838557 RepID=A0A9D2U150_9FIRM|nr:electron transport complex subunit RsxC [Candidatus Eisenbergiella stercorigallinarum]